MRAANGCRPAATAAGASWCGRKAVGFAMRTRGGSPFIAGASSLADPDLAPVLAYVSPTPDKDPVFDVAGFGGYRDEIQALPSYRSTQPDLG